MIGFGVPQTPQEDEPTESFIQALVGNYQIEDSTFSLYICDDSDPDQDCSPSMTLGNSNEEYIKDDQ